MGVRIDHTIANRNGRVLPHLVAARSVIVALSMPILDSILILTVFSAVSALPADDAVRCVTLYQGHVNLEVPTDWEEIPAEDLESFSLQLAEASGGRVGEVYQHGFFPDSRIVISTLPLILVQIRESGRLPYGQFLHLPPLEKLQRSGSRPIIDRMGPVLSGLDLQKVWYDRKNHTLHLANKLALKTEGRVSVSSVSFLTERGLFTLHCYAHTPQATAVATIFDRIIDSVRFDDALRYQPRFVDRWPPKPSTVAYGAAALIAIILVLRLIRSRRRRS